MSRGRLPAGVVALGLLTVAACLPSHERRRIDFERMRLQQRYDVYGASRVFPNHQSMQTPPAGTIPRESGPDTGVVGTGMSGGQEVANVPFMVTPRQLSLGGEKFAVYCAVCHGSAGFGGSIVAENMGPPRPPSLRSALMLASPAGHIFAVASHGKGRMPAYAAQLPAEERWAVVAYVRQIQHTPATGDAAINDSIRALEIARIDSTVQAERTP